MTTGTAPRSHHDPGSGPSATGGTGTPADDSTPRRRVPAAHPGAGAVTRPDHTGPA
ncbi:hypothetical protein [Nocardiopsis trehalosi]|jgi:hypothetical protein|uniref:hypothetical protein n=1 Tax=Nocardiopsis trehalosi TaxID=109329 RepID=UPI0012FA40F9|nr:hypothetical protein [Nocardiopsis trehalosi]